MRAKKKPPEPAPKRKKPARKREQAGRATDALMELRIQDLVDIRLDGAQQWDCRRYVAEKEAEGDAPWTLSPGAKPLSERRIYELVELADARITAECVRQNTGAIHRHLSQRRSLFARAVNTGELSTALSVLKDEAALLDLYPAAKASVKLQGDPAAPIRLVEELVVVDGNTDAPA